MCIKITYHKERILVNERETGEMKRKMKILLTAINAKYIHSNLAIYDLRAYAGAYKEEIELAEFTINQRAEYILSEIYKRKPDILCFSCYIWNISYVRRVAEEFHKICKEVPIWLGGPEVSYESERFLQDNPFITGIMRGEGEKIFLNLCRYYHEEAKALEQIPGLVFQKGDEICVNLPETPVDLSDVPFPYENEDFQNKIVYYESSRGCPFCCSYCLSSVDRKLRFRDMELLKRELRFFIDRGAPQVKFVDRTFNCRRDRAMEIWRFIKKHDRGVTNFHFEVAADLLTDDEVAFLAGLRPGLIQLEIGVQSTNAETIEEIRRTMDLSRVKSVVRKIKEGRNIHQHLDLIAGLPMEDFKSFARSFDEIYEIKPEQLQLGFLKILKGSYMYSHASEYGMIYTSHPPYEVLSTRWLCYEEIQRIKLVEEMLEVYYNSGQFRRSISVLEEMFDSAFSMFESLGNYYESRGYLAQKHTRNQRMEILLDFAGETAAGQRERLREAAVYDIYARENAKSRPAFAPKMDGWKDMSRNYCKKGKLSHLERFFYEEDGQKRDKPYYILFDYENRDLFLHSAKERRIEEL